MALTQPQLGVLAMIGCASIWGLSGIYYKALLDIPALEVIAHRTIWSGVLFGILIAVQGRLGLVWQYLRQPRLLRLLFLAALMISVNWSGFVFSIQYGWALEASFGYYILPLLAVFLGVVLLGEAISRLQMLAVAIATVAVIVLGVGLGATPWMSLLLASTFAIYGLIKRQIEIGPILSVFIEVILVAPFALAYLVWLHWSAEGAFGTDLTTSLLLIGAGPMTAVPLLFFAYATRRINFATVGLVQYLNPTLQFLVAVFLFGEVFTRWHGIALPMIWIALILYSASSFRQSQNV